MEPLHAPGYENQHQTPLLSLYLWEYPGVAM
jgi:hypothetical protein